MRRRKRPSLSWTVELQTEYKRDREERIRQVFEMLIPTVEKNLRDHAKEEDEDHDFSSNLCKGIERTPSSGRNNNITN